MRRAGGHEVLGLEVADDLVHASVVVAMVVRDDDQRGDTFALQELGRGVAGGPGVHQGRLAFRRANQDRIALADVEEINDERLGGPARPSREELGGAWRGWAGKQQAEQDQETQKPAGLHSLMSPPGSVFSRSFWTCRVSSASLRVSSGSASSVSESTSPAFAPGGSSALGRLIDSPSSVRRTAIDFFLPSKRSRDRRVVTPWSPCVHLITIGRSATCFGSSVGESPPRRARESPTRWLCRTIRFSSESSSDPLRPETPRA